MPAVSAARPPAAFSSHTHRVMGRVSDDSESLDYIRRTFDRWAEADAFYAVLTDRDKKGNRWEPEEFFARGRAEIDQVMHYLRDVGVEPRPGRALDFGCGLGRLSQALATHFHEVVGVDISEQMVSRAQELDRYGPGRVRYVVNTAARLPDVASDSVDLVYSNITLQHIPPRYVRTYVADFFRVLRPGGLALFQMRSGPSIRPGSLRDWLYRLNREHFRHVLQRLQGLPPYEIHFLARSQMEQVIRDSGGEILDVVDASGGRGKGFRYLAAAR